jgi:Sulfotransferase domain
MRKRFESTTEDEEADAAGEPEPSSTTPATARRRMRRKVDQPKPPPPLSPQQSPYPRTMGFSVLFLVLWTVSVMGCSSLLWRVQQQQQSFKIGEVVSSRALREVLPQAKENVNDASAYIVESFTRDNNNNGPTTGLKLVWLMSFPNSGTSYTSRLVREATRTMTATNYADEVIKIDSTNGQQQSQPVYVDQPMGPFWVPQDNFTAPQRYVLTKTHCGLRCTECPPELYAETTYSFKRKCAGTKYLPPFDGGSTTTTTTHRIAKYGHYPSFDRVEKAIHLVRDPFDNVVSRFHHLLTTRTMKKKYINQTMTTQQQQPHFPATKHGFLEYCLQIDGLFTWNEIKYAHFKNMPALRDLWLGSCGWIIVRTAGRVAAAAAAVVILSQHRLFPSSPSRVPKRTYRYGLPPPFLAVPCHAEFCKYIEWHNLAFHTTSDLELDTLVVHYEAYPEAGGAVLDFLQFNDRETVDHNDSQPMTTMLFPEFEHGKTYRDYFLPSERRIVQTAFAYMASKRTWSHLQQYFPGETEETTTTAATS